MLIDSFFWATDRAQHCPPNVVLVSKKTPVGEQFLNRLLQCFGFDHDNLLLVHPEEMPSIPTVSPEWLWKSLLGELNTTTCRRCGSIIAKDEMPDAWRYDSNVSTSVTLN